MTNLPKDVCEKILYTEEQITGRCKDLATKISKDYEGGEVTCISILNGSFMFASEIVKSITCDCRIDFMQISTYGDSSDSGGKFIVKKDLSLDIAGKDVIILEDIIDTGFTLVNLIEYLKKYNPNSVKICAMIDKPKRRTQNITGDYIAFAMENDEFIVGFGLDYAQRYRNLPYIGVLKKEIYS